VASWFLAELFSALKMEAVCSSETSVDTQRTTRRYIQEEDTFHIRVKIISYITGNTLCLHHKDQSVNAVQGNNRRLL
jgi:hypothetical protein